MIKKIKTVFFLFIPHISLSNIVIMFVFKSQVHLLVMNLINDALVNLGGDQSLLHVRINLFLNKRYSV
ncbi:hypothetical protein GT3921_03040 [Geobacillus thermocatenulatus]|nr:hypothetical protein GT3921_03040 [Geobacillus thermocatenulatus]